MARKAWITVLAGVLVMIGGRAMGGGGAAAQGNGFHCTDMTLRGTFGIQLQGTVPVPPALGGGTQTVVGVVIRTYDGSGHFTQLDNIKGSVTGLVPDRFGAGTYHVNADCSATTQFVPGPGILIEEKMVIVDHGNEVRAIASSPLAFMVSAVQKRIDHR